MTARPLAERQAEPAVYYSGQPRSPQVITRYRATQRARMRAHRITARIHEEEYLALWVDRGASDSPGYDARRDAAQRAVVRNHPEDFERVFADEKRREGL